MTKETLGNIPETNKEFTAPDSNQENNLEKNPDKIRAQIENEGPEISGFFEELTAELKSEGKSLGDWFSENESIIKKMADGQEVPKAEAKGKIWDILRNLDPEKIKIILEWIIKISGWLIILIDVFKPDGKPEKITTNKI